MSSEKESAVESVSQCYDQVVFRSGMVGRCLSVRWWCGDRCVMSIDRRPVRVGWRSVERLGWEGGFECFCKTPSGSVEEYMIRPRTPM